MKVFACIEITYGNEGNPGVWVFDNSKSCAETAKRLRKEIPAPRDGGLPDTIIITRTIELNS